MTNDDGLYAFRRLTTETFYKPWEKVFAISHEQSTIVRS